MYVLIDNYDSFTYNLFHYLEDLQVEVRVFRNDEITPDGVRALSPRGVILSPGPCSPDEAGICLELVRTLKGQIPILGVCLGHQAIGQVYGGSVVRAPYVMHGKTSAIHHSGDSVFGGLPHPFHATRYHSLVVDRQSVTGGLTITAETEDGLVMGLSHADDNVHGVQFHPESIASEHGHALLANFLALADPKASAA